MDGDGAGVGEERVAPDRFHQLVAREDPARGGPPGRRAGRTRAGSATAPRRRGRPAGSPARSAAARARSAAPPSSGRRDPAQHRVDAGDQLGRRERLDDVVVGALAQADEAIGLLAAGGQQDHRDARPRSLVQLPHHLDPVDPRQHQVEDDEVGTVQRPPAAAPRARRRPGRSRSRPAPCSGRRPRRSSARRRRPARCPGRSRPSPRLSRPPPLTEGEGIAHHPRFRFELEHVVARPAAGRRGCRGAARSTVTDAAVDVGAGVGGGDRLAVEQDPHPAVGDRASRAPGRRAGRRS